MKNDTHRWMNRTGMATASTLAKEMLELADMTQPPKSSRTLSDVRIDYARESPPMTAMPPPGMVKELTRNTAKALGTAKGEKATVLVDRIGERLAFERTAVRLYEAVLTKHDAFGSWRGGPTRPMLEEMREDELSHFHILNEAMAYLGADSTAVTPSANLLASITSGLPRVITDPRTDLRQSLEAMMIAELADNACWETLIDLARTMDHQDMAELFEVSLSAEQRHLRRVRAWLTAATLEEAMAQDGRSGRRNTLAAGTARDGRMVARKRPIASARTAKLQDADE